MAALAASAPHDLTSFEVGALTERQTQPASEKAYTDRIRNGICRFLRMYKYHEERRYSDGSNRSDGFADSSGLD